jgi:hypothetical protein
MAFANQQAIEAPVLRLFDHSNLYIDSLDLAIYFQEIISLEQALLVIAVNESYLIPYDSLGFHLDRSMKSEQNNDEEECLLLADRQYCWVDVREKRNFAGRALVYDNKVLIKQIPNKLTRGQNLIEAPQRHLNLRQYYLNGSFVFAYFKAQRIYILSPEDNSIVYYDFPEITDGLWYYFPDTGTGRHYLVKETIANQFELYGFYLGSGVQKLFDLETFPVQLFNESVLYKEEYKGEIVHFLKPFKAYK